MKGVVRSKSVRRVIVLHSPLYKGERVIELRARPFNFRWAKEHAVKIRIFFDGQASKPIWSENYLGHASDHKSAAIDLRWLLNIVCDMLQKRSEFAERLVLRLKSYLSGFHDEFTETQLDDFVYALRFSSDVVSAANAIRWSILAAISSLRSDELLQFIADELKFLANSEARFAVTNIVIAEKIAHRFATNEFDQFKDFVRVCVTNGHPAMEVIA